MSNGFDAQIKMIKGIVHPKIKTLSSFTHPRVVPNLYEFLLWKKITKLLFYFTNISKALSTYLMFPISRSLSTSRRRTDELGSRLERPINFECKLNEPMHIGMQLLHPAATDHSVSISRRQVQCIFSFSFRSRAVTSFCSWLLLNEWIQRVEHALRKTLLLVVRHYSGGGSSHVEWTAHIRLHYPLFVLQMTISPVRFSTLK